MTPGGVPAPGVVIEPVRKATTSSAQVEKAQWTTEYVNNLPDSAFLYVAPGGKQDEQGKTVPRSLRHFPVKGADGKVDPAHVANARSRIPQSDLPQNVKDEALAAAGRLLRQEKRAARKFGTAWPADLNGKQPTEKWDPDQPRDEAGRFGEGGGGGEAGGGSGGTGGGAAERDGAKIVSGLGPVAQGFGGSLLDRNEELQDEQPPITAFWSPRAGRASEEFATILERTDSILDDTDSKLHDLATGKATVEQVGEFVDERILQVEEAADTADEALEVFEDAEEGARVPGTGKAMRAAQTWAQGVEDHLETIRGRLSAVAAKLK